LGEDITENEFDTHMRYLVDQGYRTIFLKDWIQRHLKPDAKTIAITFDDGFVDNWVYAFPILKKYGLKATIFVITVRALGNLACRPNLGNIWTGHFGEEDLPEITTDWEANQKCVLREEGSPDFLSWKEMEEMEASRHVDIQSHAHYHRDFFVSRSIADFNQNKYFGVGWLTDGDTRYGIPLYPRKSALMARRYFDDKGLRDYLAERVGGPDYFRNRLKKDWFRELLRLAVEYRRMHSWNERFETSQEQKNRIYSELVLSRKLIQERLNKCCELICWPWGEYTRLSIQLAKEAGFRGAIAFSCGQNIQGTEEGTWHIKRFSPPRGIEDFGRILKLATTPRGAMALRVYEKTNKMASRIAQRIASGDFVYAAKRKIGAFFKG
jgi:peptidoglycan/xylan/chitin deacetylase (PgdA/CDA1 family)